MSFDELPSDAPPPALPAGENSASDREASDRDAPPSGQTRRRRAPRTGTDAASAEPTSAAEPIARATRRTRQTSKEGNQKEGEKGRRGEGEKEVSEASGENRPSPLEAVTEQPAPNVRTSSRRRVAKTAPTEVSAPPTPAAPDESDAAKADPSVPASRRRSRRKEAENVAPATPDVAPSVVPETAPELQASAPADGAETVPPETPARTSRRRTHANSVEQGTEEGNRGKGKGKDQSTPPNPQSGTENPKPARTRRQRGASVEAAAPQVGILPAPKLVAGVGGETNATDTEPLLIDVESGQASVAVTNAQDTAEQTDAANTVGETETSAETEAKTEEDADAVSAAETVETGETSETRSRKRRNRRNNKGRREPRSTEIKDNPTPAAIAAPPEAEIAAPLIPVVVEEELEPIDLSVGTHLIVRNGLPQIHINGNLVPPVLFFGSMEGTKNAQRVLTEARRAAKTGVHLHSTLIELPCPLTEAHYVLDEIDVRLRALLDADPDGYVMPRLVFVPARGWKREYASEISVYNDGTNGDPSLTSERFWQECERALHMLIEHIQSQTYGERVFAYHLERGEWFQPTDQGYDRSTANRDAFRDWLREKYQNSLILLRAAWYDGDVQFHTAEIPPPLGKPNPQRAFYETRRERSVIDFNEFTSETTANRLAQLAKTVKKACHNNALVSICYGYTLEFGHGFSGHLALNRLLASPHVDLICGPPSYRDRKPTGAASFPAPVDSPRLHGKLWLSEDDTKTYLAPAQQEPDDFNPRLGDRFATEQAQARAIGRALATNTAVGWMDLWGEGWLDDEGLWDRIGAFADRMVQQGRQTTPPAGHDVVVLIDEKSLLHVQKGELFFRKLTNGLRDILQRAGINYGMYLQSDLLETDFPTDARLYLFLTPFRLPTEQRTAIREKLQRDNKTLVWLYAPGACEERPSGGTGMEDVATATVGLILRQQAWNSEVGSRITDPNHLLTERLGGRDIGARERLNPSFYVDDPGAAVVAEYHGSGLPSLAARSFGNWKSVFVGDPILPLELLRGICRYAGVPVYVTGGEDVVSIGNGWITIHASRDGQRTLRLPNAQCIYDMQEKRLVAENSRDYRYFLRMGTTRTFCIGTRERFAALGLSNLESPTRARSNSERDERGESGERSESAETDSIEAATPVKRMAEPEAELVASTDVFPVQSNVETEPDDREGEREISAAPISIPEPVAFSEVEPIRTSSELLTVRADSDLPAPEEEPHLLPPPEDEDDLPHFEPFPQPRAVARPSSLSTAPPSLRDDLATLKAVLEMEMPEPEDEDENLPPAPALSLPREGLPGLEAVLGPDLSANRRRRRRGGRGRGRKANGELDTDTEEPENPV